MCVSECVWVGVCGIEEGGGERVGGSVGLIRCQKEDQESRGANSLSVTRALFSTPASEKKNFPFAFCFNPLLCFVQTNTH